MCRCDTQNHPSKAGKFFDDTMMTLRTQDLHGEHRFFIQSYPQQRPSFVEIRRRLLLTVDETPDSYNSKRPSVSSSSKIKQKSLDSVPRRPDCVPRSLFSFNDDNDGERRSKKQQDDRSGGRRRILKDENKATVAPPSRFVRPRRKISRSVSLNDSCHYKTKDSTECFGSHEERPCMRRSSAPSLRTRNVRGGDTAILRPYRQISAENLFIREVSGCCSSDDNDYESDDDVEDFF